MCDPPGNVTLRRCEGEISDGSNLMRAEQKHLSRLFDVPCFKGRGLEGGGGVGGGCLSEAQKIEMQTAAGSRRSTNAALQGGGTCVDLTRYLGTRLMELCLRSHRGFVRNPAASNRQEGDFHISNKVVI